MATGYPFTKFYFAVDLGNDYKDAAFTEIKVPTASVEVIKYRDGNSKSFTQFNVPGLVSHDPISLKYALRTTVEFRKWILTCTKDTGRAKSEEMRKPTVTISLMDPSDDSVKKQWILNNAWVSKYEGSDLNSTATDIAIETIEIAYDTLEIKE